MVGAPVEVELPPSDCERTVVQALELLDQYNRLVSGAEVAKLANPAPETCRWCPFKLVCPEFWANADNSWAEHLGTAAVGGVLASPPMPVHEGSGFALSLHVEEGTEASESVYLAPFERTTHSALSQVPSGARVRVVGLARRADGSVTPTQRTVVARTTELPDISLAARTPQTVVRIEVTTTGGAEKN